MNKENIMKIRGEIIFDTYQPYRHTPKPSNIINIHSYQAMADQKKASTALLLLSRYKQTRELLILFWWALFMFLT